MSRCHETRASFPAPRQWPFLGPPGPQLAEGVLSVGGLSRSRVRGTTADMERLIPRQLLPCPRTASHLAVSLACETHTSKATRVVGTPQAGRLRRFRFDVLFSVSIRLKSMTLKLLLP